MKIYLNLELDNNEEAAGVLIALSGILQGAVIKGTHEVNNTPVNIAQDKGSLTALALPVEETKIAEAIPTTIEGAVTNSKKQRTKKAEQAKKIEEPKEAEEAEQVEEPKEPEEDFSINTNAAGEAVTYTTIRARVRKLISEDKANKTKVLEALKKAGAASIDELKKELLNKFDKFLDKLEK